MRQSSPVLRRVFSRAAAFSVSGFVGLFMAVAPVALPIAEAAATITSTSPLTSGTYGTAYSTTITGTGLGGSPAWSISAGALPSGLSIGATTGTISGTPTAAGTFNFTVQVIGSSTTTKAFVLVINTATLTVTANSSQTKVYGSSDPTLTYALSGLTNGDTASVVTGSLSRAAGENVGTYAISQGSVTATSNYTISFVSANFSITTAPLTVTADNLGKVYGASDPTLTYAISGLVNGDTSTVVTGTLLRDVGETVATYAVNQGSVTATSNYALTFVPGTFAISVAPLTITANSTSKTYGDTVVFTGNEFTTSALQPGDSVTSVTLTSAGGAATATVAGSPYAITPSAAVGTGLGNYSITYTDGSLTVNTAALTVTADSGQTKVYGVSDPTFTYTVTAGALLNGDAFSGVLSRAAGENVGTYAITQGTLDAGSNYTLSFVADNFSITAAPITVTADSGQTKVYGAVDPTFTYTVTAGALVGADAFSGVLSRAAGENVGTYAITQGTLDAGTNYTLTFVADNFAITTAPLTVTADNLSKVYGSSDPTLTYAISGLVNGDTSSVVTGTPVRVAGETVNTYAINQGSVAATSNYALTFVPGTFTITAAPLTVTADNLGKVYGASDPTLTYAISGLVNGDTSAVVTGTPARVSGENVTTYAINQGTVVATANYSLTFVPGTFTISAAPLTITANSTSKTYGDTVTFAGTEFTTSALQPGDSVTSVTLTSAGAAATATVAGSPYPITPSAAVGTGLGNYSITYTDGSLTVNTAALTVTADSGQTKVYGASDPTFTYTVTAGALLNGDTFSGALSRAAGDSVGTYAITQGTLDAGTNYTLTFVPDNFAITVAPLTITVDAGQTKVYGAVDPAFTYSLSGLTNGDTSAVVTGTLVRAAGEDVGSYAITQGTVAASANYAVTFVGNSFSITQASTTTALVSDTNPAMDTDTITFTATVTGPSPTGTVNFLDNGSVIGSSSLNGSFVATFSTTLSGGGATHPITAEYQGDANHIGSTSNTVSQVVNTLPKLTVTKVVDNGNNGSLVVADFPLHIDASTVTSGVVNTGLSVGAHTVTEDAQTGYDLDSLVGDCASDGSITLALNDNKSCIFTNNDVQPVLTVTVDVINDDGIGTNTASEVTVGVTSGSAFHSPSPASFAGDSAGTTVAIDAGSFSVSLTDRGALTAARYAMSTSGDCGATGLLPGDVKSCTITLDDIPPTLTVTSSVINDNGGTLTVSDFLPLTVDGDTVTSGTPYTIYQMGSHAVDAPPTSTTYARTIGGDCASDGAITLDLGDNKTCTVTYDDIPPTLTIIKQVQNTQGGTAEPGDFTLRVDGQTVTNGVPVTLNVGQHEASEADSDYYGTITGDCGPSNGALYLNLGENKTCTITNRERTAPLGSTGEPSNGGSTGGHSGNGTTAGFAAANFIAGGTNGVAPGGFGGGVSGPITNDEKDKICKLQKTADFVNNDALAEVIGAYFATLLNRPDPAPVISMLKDPAACSSGSAFVPAKAKPIAIRANSKGVVVSTNPVWNACVSGKPVSIGLIKSNRDVFTVRHGNLTATVPFSCRDYHRGDVSVWQHPDFPGIELTLDKKGHMVGIAPAGYVVVRDKAQSIATTDGSVAATK